MKKWLFALSVWLALPGLSWAINGDPCTFTTGTVTAGSAGGGNVPLPAAIGGINVSVPTVLCVLLVDVTAAGPFSAGPIWVPGGGQNVHYSVIRALSGTSAAGCRYDAVSVYTMSNTNIGAEAERASLGILDAQGTGGGVKQIEHFGELGPYLYLTGTATNTGDTCGTSHRLQIQLLLYPNLVTTQ